MKEINFNINHSVKVKLTDVGKGILRKRYNETEVLCRFKKGHLQLPKEDEQGYSTWQLWDLMEKLGKYISILSGQQPFETDIIIIIED